MIEKFYDQIKEKSSKTGKSNYVTIPFKIMKGCGFKKGDKVKVLILKV